MRCKYILRGLKPSFQAFLYKGNIKILKLLLAEGHVYIYMAKRLI